jgi:hypothetical protein
LVRRVGSNGESAEASRGERQVDHALVKGACNPSPEF